MKIGYARVSTVEQNLDRQLDILKQISCDRIYEEKVSGIKKDRSVSSKQH
ncbi:MAG: recombinase family protein [Clostridium sp.]